MPCGPPQEAFEEQQQRRRALAKPVGGRAAVSRETLSFHRHSLGKRLLFTVLSPLFSAFPPPIRSGSTV